MLGPVSYTVHTPSPELSETWSKDGVLESTRLLSETSLLSGASRSSFQEKFSRMIFVCLTFNSDALSCEGTLEALELR